MEPFEDDISREVYETRFSKHVPKEVAVKAHPKMHVLLAARSLQDVGVLGPIVRWANTPGRFGLEIDGKWHITFAWSPYMGAYGIRLERR
jgi:plasmid maintenance system killer protein